MCFREERDESTLCHGVSWNPARGLARARGRSDRHRRLGSLETAGLAQQVHHLPRLDRRHSHLEARCSQHVSVIPGVSGSEVQVVLVCYKTLRQRHIILDV